MVPADRYLACFPSRLAASTRVCLKAGSANRNSPLYRKNNLSLLKQSVPFLQVEKGVTTIVCHLQ